MLRRNAIKVVATLLLASSLMACSESQVSQQKPNDSTQQSQSKNDSTAPQSSTQNDELPTSWNKQDMDAKTNGNGVYAILQINDNGMDTKNAKQVPLSEVTKAPFKYIGNVSSVEGTATMVKEYPPGGDTSKTYANGGPVGEIVMIDSDGKSQTPVDFMLLGDMKNINANDQVKICGYVIGTVTGENKLGGKTEELMMIGTKAEKETN